MPPSRELVLEQTVVDAWPALEHVELDGWILRASGGPTHRGNSAATLRAGSGLDFALRIERTEAWYRERNKSARVQVGPCSRPEGLDAVLDARGYAREGEAWVATATAREVVRRSRPTARAGEVAHRPVVAAALSQRMARAPSVFRTVVEHAPSPEWLAMAAGASRFAESQDVFFGFLERLEGRSSFVIARDQDGAPAATCLCIRAEGRLGVYAMFTLPAQRRRGAGRALLHAAGSSALHEGQAELYLLVEGGNSAARSLYAACGFKDVYRYHYRVLGWG